MRPLTNSAQNADLEREDRKAVCSQVAQVSGRIGVKV